MRGGWGGGAASRAHDPCGRLPFFALLPPTPQIPFPSPPFPPGTTPLATWPCWWRTGSVAPAPNSGGGAQGA